MLDHKVFGYLIARPQFNNQMTTTAAAGARGKIGVGNDARMQTAWSEVGDLYSPRAKPARFAQSGAAGNSFSLPVASSPLMLFRGVRGAGKRRLGIRGIAGET